MRAALLLPFQAPFSRSASGAPNARRHHAKPATAERAQAGAPARRGALRSGAGGGRGAGRLRSRTPRPPVTGSFLRGGLQARSQPPPASAWLPQEPPCGGQPNCARRDPGSRGARPTRPVAAKARFWCGGRFPAFRDGGGNADLPQFVRGSDSPAFHVTSRAVRSVSRRPAPGRAKRFAQPGSRPPLPVVAPLSWARGAFLLGHARGLPRAGPCPRHWIAFPPKKRARENWPRSV